MHTNSTAQVRRNSPEYRAREELSINYVRRKYPDLMPVCGTTNAFCLQDVAVNSRFNGEWPEPVFCPGEPNTFQ